MIEKKHDIRSLGEYQRMMDRFETCGDGFILPDLNLVLRVDAHRLGPSWGAYPESSYPFGKEFVEALQLTARDMMACGFRVVLAYVHGDEISLLLDPSESANQRRRSKVLSLAASASAIYFYRHFGYPAAFHARLSELPTTDHVIDYFFWQRKVATRNFFVRTLGILLAAKGLDAKEIDAKLVKLNEEERFELAAELGRPRETISRYDRFGSLVWWREKGSSFELVEWKEPPESDDEYMTFLMERVKGPGYLAGESLDGVTLGGYSPPASKGGTPRRSNPGPASQPQVAKPPPQHSGAAPGQKFRLGRR